MQCEMYPATTVATVITRSSKAVLIVQSICIVIVQWDCCEDMHESTAVAKLSYFGGTAVVLDRGTVVKIYMNQQSLLR